MDTLIGFFFGIVAAAVALSVWRRCSDSKTGQKVTAQETGNGQPSAGAESSSATKGKERLSADTRELLMKTLTEMGCEPEEMDALHIRFEFQARTFIAAAIDDVAFINIYDYWWYEVPIDSSMEVFARIKKVINSLNRGGSYSVFYSINTEDNVMGIHTKKNILFISEIPMLKDYLKSQLNVFFSAERLFFKELNESLIAERQDQHD